MHVYLNELRVALDRTELSGLDWQFWRRGSYEGQARSMNPVVLDSAAKNVTY
jgi:hypothetical protein